MCTYGLPYLLGNPVGTREYGVKTFVFTRDLEENYTAGNFLITRYILNNYSRQGQTGDQQVKPICLFTIAMSSKRVRVSPLSKSQSTCGTFHLVKKTCVKC